MFIVFEGVDGTGKTTQLHRCREWLEDAGHPVLACRDPGSTGLGDRLRSVLLERSEIGIGIVAEMFLFMAARAQLVEEVIRPALERRQVVLCDRFLLSTVVYQGRAGELDPDLIWQIGKTATGGLEPDLTLVFDLPIETVLKRIGDHGDRVESRGLEYLTAVQRGFLAESALRKNVEVIDASGTPAEIHEQVRTAVQRRWPAGP
jgi:dTMP kinase